MSRKWNTECGYSINCAVLSPDGQCVFIGTERNIIILSVISGSIIRTDVFENDVWRVAFPSISDRVAVGLSNGVIQFMNVSTGASLLTLTGHNEGICSVVFSPHDGGRTLASASGDKTARIWDTTTGVCLHVLHGHIGWVNSIAYSPDGSRLVSGSDNSIDRALNVKSDICPAANVKVWDVATGACPTTINIEGNCCTVVYSLDGRTIIAASGTEVMLLDAGTGTVHNTLQGYSSNITSLALESSLGVLITNARGESTKLWNPCTGTDITILDRCNSFYSSMSVRGNMLVTAAFYRTVELWDISAFLPDTRVLTLVLGRRRRGLPHIPQELWQLILEEFC